mgnify:CR=1 FL=1
MNADERMHKNIIEMKNRRYLYSRLTEDEMHLYAKWLLEECNEPIDEEHITTQVKQALKHFSNHND